MIFKKIHNVPDNLKHLITEYYRELADKNVDMSKYDFRVLAWFELSDFHELDIGVLDHAIRKRDSD